MSKEMARSRLVVVVGVPAVFLLFVAPAPLLIAIGVVAYGVVVGCLLAQAFP